MTPPVVCAVVPTLISGTATDPDDNIISVEVGIEPSGSAIVWNVVDNFDVSGVWNYSWTPPASGQYTIHARATDNDGNRGFATPTISITADVVPPIPPANRESD